MSRQPGEGAVVTKHFRELKLGPPVLVPSWSTGTAGGVYFYVNGTAEIQRIEISLKAAEVTSTADSRAPQGKIA
jgi:hypothetical protein